MPTLFPPSVIVLAALLIAGISACDSLGDKDDTSYTLAYVSGTGQQVVPGETAPEPLVVRAVTTSGKGVAGQTVKFVVHDGDAVVLTPSTVSDAGGQASTHIRIGTSDKPVIVHATLSSGGPVIFDLNIVEASFFLEATHPQLLCGPPNTSAQIIVRISDRNGFPANKPVHFKHVSGNGHLNPNIMNLSHGEVSTRLQLGDDDVPNVLEVSTPGATPLTLDVRSLFAPEFDTFDLTVQEVIARWRKPEKGAGQRYRMRRNFGEYVPAIVTADSIVARDNTFLVGDWYNIALEILSPTDCSIATPEMPLQAGRRIDSDQPIEDVFVDGNRGLLYLSFPDVDEIVVLAADDYSEYARLSISGGPGRMRPSRDGNAVWIGLEREPAVVKLDLQTHGREVIPVESKLIASRVLDIAETAEEELFLSMAHVPGNWNAHIVRMRLSDRRAENVAEGRISDSATLAAHPDGRRVYAGDFEVLHELDASSVGAPIVRSLERYITDDLMLSPNGEWIITYSGAVIATDSFSEAALIGVGRPALGPDGATLYKLRGHYEGISSIALPSFVETGKTEYAIVNADGFRITPDGRRALLWDQNQLWVVPLR